MMGPIQSSEPKLFHYGVNLEKRVRANNPLRRIQELIDFSFVRAEVAERYGRDGHESEDPIVIVKLMLLLFLDDIASERELMRIVAERMDYLWFLGFDLDEEIPDHSVVSKARRRWGPETFRSIFVVIVEACVKAGLVDGGKIHMDGSMIDANASRESVRSGPPELIEALMEAYRREEAKLESSEPDKDDDEGKVRGRESDREQRTVSQTDPDAVVMRKRGQGVARPRYKSHRAIDDRCGVITAVETTAGDVGENQKLVSLIEQHEAQTGQKVGVVVADAQYGTNDNFAECHRRGIRSHMADLKARHSNEAQRRGIFTEEQFQYDAEMDSYICPAGQQLKRAPSVQDNFQVYRGSRKICGSCSLRAQCTRAKKSREIKRHIQYERIREARIESHSGWAKRDRRRRKHLMEGSFADAATNHGFKRARWRRLPNVRIQDWLIASCQNIRMLLQHHGRRHAAAMAVVADPSSSGRPTWSQFFRLSAAIRRSRFLAATVWE